MPPFQRKGSTTKRRRPTATRGVPDPFHQTRMFSCKGIFIPENLPCFQMFAILSSFCFFNLSVFSPFILFLLQFGPTSFRPLLMRRRFNLTPLISKRSRSLISNQVQNIKNGNFQQNPFCFVFSFRLINLFLIQVNKVFFLLNLTLESFF